MDCRSERSWKSYDTSPLPPPLGSLAGGLAVAAI